MAPLRVEFRGAGGFTLIRVKTPISSFLSLASLAIAGALVVASSTALAGETPSVVGTPFEACGSWKNKMRNYGGYRISDFNSLVPPNFAVDESQATPLSTWEFIDDGLSRGFPVDNAFVGTFEIVDPMGASRAEVINGSFRQKKRKLILELNSAPLQDRFIDPGGVFGLFNLLETTQPHGYPDLSGPFRFRAGALPDEEMGTLPGGLDTETDYYIRYISDTVFALALTDGTAVDLTTIGQGRHTIYPAGESLANSFASLSELFLFGDREVIGVLDFVSVDRVKLKAKVNKDATELKIKLSGKTRYDIDTDDVEAENSEGKLSFSGKTNACPAPAPPPLP